MISVLYLLIAVLAGVAVFHDAFRDNLPQRIGLSAASFGALIQVYGAALGRAESVFLCGLVVYAVGTILKVRKYNTP